MVDLKVFLKKFRAILYVSRSVFLLCRNIIRYMYVVMVYTLLYSIHTGITVSCWLFVEQSTQFIQKKKSR